MPLSYRRRHNRVNVSGQADLSNSDTEYENNTMFRTPVQAPRNAQDADGTDQTNPNNDLDQSALSDTDLGATDDEAESVVDNAEITAARQALADAEATFNNVQAPPNIPPNTDALAQLMLMMQHNAAQQEARFERQFAQTQLTTALAFQNTERQRLADLRRARRERREEQERFHEQLRELRRDPVDPSTSTRTIKPPLFDLENGKMSFPTWKSRWEYQIRDFDNIRISAVKAQKKRALLQQALSDFTLQWIGNQKFTSEQKEDADFLVAELEKYIRGTTNPLVQVTNLFNRKQEAAESVESFVTDIKERVKLCDFDRVENIGEWFPMLVMCCNTYDANVRVKLLLEKNLTFDKAVQICLEEEKAAKTSKQLTGETAADVHASSYRDQRRKRDLQRQSDDQTKSEDQKASHQRGRSQSRGRNNHNRERSQSASGDNPRKCANCGNTGHKPRTPDCPASQKKCSKCNKLGHFAKVCKSPPPDVKPETSACFGHIGVKNISAFSDDDDIQPLVHIDVDLCLGATKLQVNALPDTGANMSCISPATLNRLGQSVTSLESTRIKPTTADNSPLKVLGSIQLLVKQTGLPHPVSVRFFVIKDLKTTILSLQCLKQLKLVDANFPHNICTINQIDPEPIKTGYPDLDRLIAKYPRVFDGKCKIMKGGQHHIDLDPNAVPVSSGATRNVPEPQKEALKRTIQQLVDQDIIEQVEGPSDWLHPIVIVAKKGTAEIRLCVDFTRLNKWIRRPVNPQPTPWETVRTLPSGRTHFAVFDALKGYHQIELDEKSRALTTFLTPFGRYRYKRLPFGESDSGDVFTLRYGLAVDNSTEGRRATEDTLLIGDSDAELERNTDEFFKACNENDITLNTSKIQWNKPEVLFGGFLVNKDGYRLDSTLTRALSDFPIPKNITDVRSFCGLANQLCNFSAEISTLLLPLKPLLKKGTKFQWLEEHQKAFEHARVHLSSTKTLAYYDPNRKTRLICDASRLNGLGFVLKQLVETKWVPVQAGSRFLSLAETRYAMIELEMLAIAWACKKCAMFVEGLPADRFEIWTDHQPLVPIIDHYTLPEIENKRLQRLKMKVMHLQFTIKWVKGKENVEADSLSQAPCAQPTH